MSKLAIGIDLGTSTSEIALFRNGRPQPIADPLTGRAIVPSLVALDMDSRILVGENAVATVDLPGRGVRQVKRLMGTNATVALGDEEYRPEEVSAIILTHLRRMAEAYVGEPVTAAVISVPANFGEPARTATYNAARVAGLEVLRLVNEPTAAALAFGQQSLDAEGQIVVFDWGGGTLDVTTLEMMEGVLDIRSSFGDPKLGGTDFDDKMIDLLLRKFAAAGGDCSNQREPRRTLKQAAETTKKDLTVMPSASVFVDRFGRKAGEMAALDVSVTRDEFEAAIGDLLDRARVVVNRALKAGKFKPSSIQKILLVGGTTYIPAVRQLVAELFGMEGSAEVDPDLAVVMGAAIQASIATDQASESAPVIADVSAFGVGIDVVDLDSMGIPHLVYQPLIAPNEKIPFRRSFGFSLLHAEQDSVVVKVFQDHYGTARVPEEATPTGIEGEISDIPVSDTGEPHPLTVDFNYNNDGRIQLHAYIPNLPDKEVLIEYRPTDQIMGTGQLEDAAKRIETLMGGGHVAAPKPAAPVAPVSDSPLRRKYESLLKRASKLMDSGKKPSQTGRLARAIEVLETAIQSGDPARCESAGGALVDAVFEYEVD
ncbi:MAG: Hsp70 family protein [Fimbriimonadaceae bacterium]|nr:Hsp70 family protein [Fimbriimonadaceae bacterium]